MIRPLGSGDARPGPSLAAVLALGLALLLALTLFAACGSGDEGGEPTIGEPTATAEGEAHTPDESPTPGSEMGEAPIFWRTVDNFESVRSGEPYKVVLRVTNGYEEETLPVVASPEGSDEQLGFQAKRVEPVGPEAPGTFYHFLLDLPGPGRWQMMVVAGEDEVTIPVEVPSAESAAD